MQPQELKQLKRIVSVSVETALEIVEKKAFFAFLNNAFAFISIADNLPLLVEEVKYLNTKPELLNDLESEVVKQFGQKYQSGIVAIVMKHVLKLVLFNISGGIAIADEIKEYNQNK